MLYTVRSATTVHHARQLTEDDVKEIDKFVMQVSTHTPHSSPNDSYSCPNHLAPPCYHTALAPQQHGECGKAVNTASIQKHLESTGTKTTRRVIAHALKCYLGYRWGRIRKKKIKPNPRRMQRIRRHLLGLANCQ